MCVNNLSKVALDSAAVGIEPATSSRKSNALTTMPPSHPTQPNPIQSMDGSNPFPTLARCPSTLYQSTNHVGLPMSKVHTFTA